ncbi:hypothetical protein FB567DRAFT_512545 [Paraphoma chrysanthemicola]|uniref:Uncharacterized protein n=1 Tax=Paraphoma chrysanthemicola TaxID=798071 RepID=A0A8K0RI17_9PLEO|nr:hypothetical protein FB567DRAFT_512545 [Paraphoma chrysanthemicola]
MRASVFYSAVFAAAASAQSSSVDPYPQTSQLQFTNSLGVVTGQPAVATSIPGQPAVVTNIPTQPAAVTSQPLPADIPAVGPGLHTLVLPGTGSAFNQTRTVVVSANNSTTVAVQTSAAASASGSSGATASGSGASRASGASGSPTGTGAPQNSQGAAANVKAAAGGVLGFGAIVAAFL